MMFVITIALIRILFLTVHAEMVLDWKGQNFVQVAIDSA